MSDRFQRATDAECAAVVTTYADVPLAELAPGALSHIVAAENMTLSFADLEAGSYFPVHTHPNEQFMVVLEGNLDAILDGKLYRMGPGDVIRFPAGSMHGSMSHSDCRIVDIFTPARPDYEEKMRAARARAS